MTISPEQAAAQRWELAQEVSARVSRDTVQRHGMRRSLPVREIDDIAERILAREAKLQRRAAAARKAGLL